MAPVAIRVCLQCVILFYFIFLCSLFIDADVFIVRNFVFFYFLVFFIYQSLSIFLPFFFLFSLWDGGMTVTLFLYSNRQLLYGHLLICLRLHHLSHSLLTPSLSSLSLSLILISSSPLLDPHPSLPHFLPPSFFCRPLFLPPFASNALPPPTPTPPHPHPHY